jgi:hypothetical protein
MRAEVNPKLPAMLPSGRPLQRGTMKIPWTLLCSAVALFTAAAACDLETTGNQLQSSRVMVATVLGTPPIELSPAALVGFDGGFDAGTLDADAGVTFDGGSVTIPPQTQASLFFGERERTGLDQPPTPITGAKAFITASGGSAIALPERGAGNYELNSQQEPALEYQSGATYTFRVEHGGEVYTARVENAPQLERIEALHPPSGFIDHTVGNSFTFQRPPAPSGEERNLGFVNVFPVSDQGDKGDPTYSNMPTRPLEFLELIARPAKYREGTVTVPASAFPEKGKTYVLVLQAVKIGKAESANLFAGSAILAGTAEVGVFRTRKD